MDPKPLPYKALKGISEKDVSTNVRAQQEIIAKSGQLGVPVINVDGRVVVGFDCPKVNQYVGL